MRFAIIGTGGVGGYFGGKLALAGQDVWFVARGEHLRAMARNGLRLKTSEGSVVVPPGNMTDRLADIGPADVILLCVKAYDTEAVARQLDPILKDESIIISLQNGVDNEAIVRALIQRGTVYGGVANIYSTITAPGEVTETGGPRMVIFGPLHPPGEQHADDPRARDILSVFLHAGIRAVVSRDMFSDLWKKFVFITAVGGLTALTRLTLREILSVAESRLLLVDAMKETEAVARAAGAVIEAGFIDTVLATLQKFDTSTRSSLYYDLTHGKPLEIESLSGTVVRLGREHGIPTPVHRVIHASLLPYHILHTSR